MPDNRGKINLKTRISVEFKEEIDRAIFARGFRGKGANSEAISEALHQWIDWVAQNYGEPELRKRTQTVTPKSRVIGRRIIPPLEGTG